MTPSIRAYFRPGHRDEPAVAGTAGELDAILDELLREPFEHSLAVLYVRGIGDGNPELAVGVDAERDVGALRYADAAGLWYSKGDASVHEELLFYYYGEESEFPRDAEVPVEVLRRAAAEFLGTGSRPTVVAWQEWRP